MGFGLEPEEVKLSEHRVLLVEDRKQHVARLVLTDRRAVLLCTPKAKTGWLDILFGGRIADLIDAEFEERPRYQMRRDRFASVEEGAKGMIVFHDSGEGYGHTSFAITSSESFADWQHRMHTWAGGSTAAAPLPGARTVKS